MVQMRVCGYRLARRMESWLSSHVRSCPLREHINGRRTTSRVSHLSVTADAHCACFPQAELNGSAAGPMPPYSPSGGKPPAFPSPYGPPPGGAPPPYTYGGNGHFAPPPPPPVAANAAQVCCVQC